jgi:hypothetical protein
MALNPECNDSNFVNREVLEMPQKEDDLQQLKGIGKVLVKRLKDAGLDSFAKISQSGEKDLREIRGINPHKILSIQEQAKLLAETAHTGKQARLEALQKRLGEVKEQVSTLGESVRQRFQEEMEGKSGKKLTSDLMRIEDSLERLGDGGKKGSKRVRKALGKAQKRVTGLEDANLKKVGKGIKKARKAVAKALK